MNIHTYGEQIRAWSEFVSAGCRPAPAGSSRGDVQPVVRLAGPPATARGGAPARPPPPPGEPPAQRGAPRPTAPALKPARATTTGDDQPRPTSIRPEQLGFPPRRGVRWLSPPLLAGTALR